MAESITFGGEIRAILVGDGRNDWNTFHHTQAVTRNAAVLCGIVGHQAQLSCAEVGEDLRTNAVLATVDRQPELRVGIHGVEALVLEGIRANLVADADTATLVTS